MFKMFLSPTFRSLLLYGGALALSACTLSEDLTPPPSEDQNRILGLKVESVQFNTKRPNSALNPHEETRVGTSFIIPLGKEGPLIPPDPKDAPEDCSLEARSRSENEEPSPY